MLIACFLKTVPNTVYTTNICTVCFYIFPYYYSAFVPPLTRRALQDNSNVFGLLVEAQMANKKP